MSEKTISEIIEDLERFDGRYKRESLDAALARRDEIAPHLIDILDKVLADPWMYVDDEEYFGHVYALYLLGHYRESSAHRTIIELSSLPEDLPDLLFGDTITEDLPMLLLRTSGGDICLIKNLLTNYSADEFCRGAAARALAYAVMDGIVPRDDILDFFGSLFTGNEAPHSTHFWDMLAEQVRNLYPEELMETIENAYREGLIFPGFIEFKDFQEALTLGREACLARISKEMENYSLDDLHGRLSWWACFEETKGFEPKLMPSKNSGKDPKKKKKPKKDKKSKRKMSKGSKKKNRK